jgi:Dynamin GTPase effector domain
MGLETVKNSDLLRLPPVDAAEDAIEIMSEVRAYYQGECTSAEDALLLTVVSVAFTRFVNYMSMIIDFGLLKVFNRTLDDALLKGLGLGEDQLRERCLAYLKEDPEIVRRRNSLHQDLERFEAALADLQNIPGTPALAMRVMK